jgi:hypothetical protein
MSLAGCKPGKCLCLLLAGVEQLEAEGMDMEGAGKAHQSDAGQDTKQVYGMAASFFPM